MAEASNALTLAVDTSSYPKPGAAPSMIQTASQLGQLEQQKVSLDASKLKLINDNVQIMHNELSSLLLMPNVNKDEVMKRMNQIADTLKMPNEVRQQMINEYADADTPQAVKQKLEYNLGRMMSVQEKINQTYGAPAQSSDGQSITPVGVSPMRGVRPLGASVQQQVPPTATVNGPNNEPQFLGAQPPVLPAGSRPANPGIPGSFNPLPAVPPAAGRSGVPAGSPAIPSGTITDPAIKGPSANFGGNVLGASVEAPKPVTFAQRFQPTGPVTGQPPGVAQAATVAGEGSGKQLAADRVQGNQFAREIFPLQQAIPALEELGTKGTGPGTETLNQIKSFLLANVPGISEDDPAFKDVKNFDKAKKYLQDFVNNQGISSQSVNHLTSAMAGNPSVGISNAAAVDVAKSALALRRMKQAQLAEFESSKLTPDKYSQWAATWNTAVDPRAFGIDMMKPEAKAKLLSELKKNPKAFEAFERSVQIAAKAGLIQMPGQ